MADAVLPLPQKQLLLDMLHNALLEIRRLGRQGNAQQAADLADAFHNLPALLLSDSLRLPLLRSSLAEYQQEYGAKETASADGLLYDYLVSGTGKAERAKCIRLNRCSGFPAWRANLFWEKR